MPCSLGSMGVHQSAHMTFQTDLGARFGLSGAFECRDADGNILKTIAFTGTIPLARLDMTVEQAQQLVSQQEADDGINH